METCKIEDGVNKSKMCKKNETIPKHENMNKTNENISKNLDLFMFY